MTYFKFLHGEIEVTPAVQFSGEPQPGEIVRTDQDWRILDLPRRWERISLVGRGDVYCVVLAVEPVE